MGGAWSTAAGLHTGRSGTSPGRKRLHTGSPEQEVTPRWAFPTRCEHRCPLVVVSCQHHPVHPVSELHFLNHAKLLYYSNTKGRYHLKQRKQSQLRKKKIPSCPPPPPRCVATSWRCVCVRTPETQQITNTQLNGDGSAMGG